MDRDVVAAMNIASKGLARLASSQGLASEAMVQESDSKAPAILRVDASKLTLGQDLKVDGTVNHISGIKGIEMS
jgi:hypothetical protein